MPATELSLAAAIDRIRSGPQGPAVGAFFDFDGTLIHGFSGVPFFRKVWRGRPTRRELVKTLHTRRGEQTEAQEREFIEFWLRAWQGHTETELDEIGDQLFHDTLAGHLYPEAWYLIRAHEQAGHTLVLASAATRFQVEPAAAELGIGHTLYTELEVREGVLTGAVRGPLLRGPDKADAVRRFAGAHAVDLTDSYSYSNGVEDEAFLAATGVPTAVNPDSGLATLAAAHGWPILRFTPRGTVRPREIARTAAAAMGMLGGIAVGARRGRGSDRRTLVDSVLATGADYTLRGAGVELRVVGETNARAPRPAVFLFNHQSEFDIFVVAKVLDHGFTGVGKKELATNPVFGPLFRFIGLTFIDRGNTEQAKAALGPVVDTLRDGVSIAIAPEGTRSYTPMPGPFKKGAFHIAIQAGVPVIPIVIRNAGEIYWRNASTLRPGTIDVAVLDPIDVSAWNPGNLDANVAAVRQRYLDTLLHWPATPDQR
ncbi:HAD-IB family hydrolase [Skermania piniformis]|uniref:1-acyl-sn-glycerol-3-phosphate acyltransferase n=1 Tax=Skermania pinensis TaxID=39122 RepID=A0ABX8SAB1_9ACTN|nr:HAD-IB family hydrolase [Skermania piniformis]QXQ13410.1 HAD-IB family hydrolase [Skermania piniformis]